ncbi:MAG: hemolysin family protein [Salinivirgaceae bacterium]|nr:hemolysin family protein [Salinivirgaceae bacterium]
MATLFFYLFLALFVSFFCSISESVILSSTISYIESIAPKSRGGQILKRLKENVDRPLGAILSLNTIANTAGAAGVGAQVVEVFGNEYFGLASALLTILILIFSEIIPKTIGANYWRNLCVPMAYAIQGLVYVLYPLVIMAEGLTKLFSRKQTQTVSREEFVALANIGEKEGVFESSEGLIINNLVKMNSVKVKRIMTPRTVVLAAPENMTLEAFFKNKDFLKYSRIPVYKDSIDDITGFVLKSDILLNLANDKSHLRLKNIRRPIVNCYENATVLRFYNLLITKKEQIAVVIDEYGGMEGIVTMEDVVETMLGLEITDESDTQIDMRQLAKDKWQKRSRMIDFAN